MHMLLSCCSSMSLQRVMSQCPVHAHLLFQLVLVVHTCVMHTHTAALLKRDGQSRQLSNEFDTAGTMLVSLYQPCLSCFRPSTNACMLLQQDPACHQLFQHDSTCWHVVDTNLTACQQHALALHVHPGKIRVFKGLVLPLGPKKLGHILPHEIVYH